uniref:L-serine ammonia-lyase n=1 Tax=Timema genevievae TaxID=629358 RepID=A0A7R9K7A6_TIMGE|nr:unnamed protein product [Timema genevievae]
MSNRLHTVTPVVLSSTMSSRVPGCSVYLKMENQQLSGSFKLRGIGYHAQQAVERGASHLVMASGGNAGLALSCAAKILAVPCTVVVPVTTAEPILHSLKLDGARVIVSGGFGVHGDDYNSATKRALEEAKNPKSAYIHAYDHPEIWEGHSTIIEELEEQLPCKPEVLVVAVGGAGLLCGILSGLQKIGPKTVGACSLEGPGMVSSCSLEGSETLSSCSLDGPWTFYFIVDSVAKSLGARMVCSQALQWAFQFKVLSEVVTDAEAVSSCLQFADDQRVLVEPACGAALSAVYYGTICRLQEQGYLQMKSTNPIVVVIVCGGSGVSLQLLQNWEKSTGIVQTDAVHSNNSHD